MASFVKNEIERVAVAARQQRQQRQASPWSPSSHELEWVRHGRFSYPLFSEVPVPEVSTGGGLPVPVHRQGDSG